MVKVKKDDRVDEIKDLLKKIENVSNVKEGDTLTGEIVDISKSCIYINLKSKGTGIVYGREYKLAESFGPYEIGGDVTASVVEIENKNGYIELSIKDANLKTAWTNLNELKNKNKTVKVKVVQANKGGLMAKIEGLMGFLPVSQLSPDHYPRVKNGDKQEILRKLKDLVGEEVRVKVIDIDPKEEKLVISEKAFIQEGNKDELKTMNIGDVVEGVISGIVDFGAFIKFGSMSNIEGLIHISELSWAKVDDPRSILKDGDKVKAKIVSFAKDRIALSLKRMTEDPWANTDLKIGQVVKGKVQNINHFGIFIEIKKNINGLLHTETLKTAYPDKKGPIFNIGDEGEFVISALNKEKHRMALDIPKKKSETLKKNNLAEKVKK